FVDTTHSVSLVCVSSQAKGAIPHLGTGLTSPLATITSSTWTSCSGPLGITLSVAQVGTWSLNGTSYTSPVTTGNVSGVNANISGTCAFSVTGTADGKYSNTTHQLAMAPIAGSGNTLTIHVAGGGTACFGLIHDGDNATFTTQVPYTVTTPLGNLTITSP
ncbi:MAG: hypothetical protein ABI418_21920, partial [Jatrophihabitantaceae bacterium]